ncbi:leucine zipper putative tumor suppressor 1 isoform X2 [Uranotaenia lowii]|uniref:leucine zipper putative tumor suppressor 1 isoform X2 n=1 Tax=Uranotaenia lowii TaxID=190385 RepID=UPI002478DF34|nr:leucine zipper putative tumor suppressor 1 isoform X2 [Uranotaenia lowii]
MESSGHGAAPLSLVMTPTPSAATPLTTHTPNPSMYKSPIRPKGHYRSSSLENNPFAPLGSGGKTSLSLAQPNFTGTLKSRREQKRISDFLSKQAAGGGSSVGGSCLGLTNHQQQQRDPNESSIRKAHFENIREIFEKNNSKNALNHKAASTGRINGSLPVTPGASTIHDPGSQSVTLSADDKPPKIQSCSGILEKGKQVIRPIAFKPVPYKCNTPNFVTNGSMSSSAIMGNGSGRLTDLGDRFGSTPSLGPPMSIQYKFGSTTDLHHHHHHHNMQHSLHGSGTHGTSGTGPSSMNATPTGSYSMHHYGSLHKKSSGMTFKTYDSLESILKLPDSMIASYPNPSTSQSSGLYAPAHDLLDTLAPSPSDSGISELEAALRDRDSELAFLRQTMEHNEQDKEKHWEQELNRLKAIHESRLRAGAQKVHKLEQLLMMQTFQLRQDKKRLQEDINRIHTECSLAKEQAEQQKAELCRLKLTEKDLREQNGDLLDEIQMLRRVISDLKERLEESEWSLCQRNGEVALMKTQLKDAQSEVTSKDQEIVQLRSDIKSQSIDDISIKKSEIKKELDIDLELSQLNRMIIFKDQIIVVMNNEVQKLRKELSDLSIMRGYEGAPTGRYSRYKKKLDYIAQQFEEANKNDNMSGNQGLITGGDKNNNLSSEKHSDENPEDEDCKQDVSVISNEIIKNYYNHTLDLNKKLFLNTQICNYSDEDKSSIIETYNAKNITLELDSLVTSKKPKTVSSSDEDNGKDQTDSYQQISSDDDYKSMTPTHEPEDDEEDGKERKSTVSDKQDASPNKAATVRKDSEAVQHLDQLRRQLLDCRIEFEQERLKWADEKEKVLVYQRQLQQNYVEMCKRTAALEEKLKTIEKQPN